MLIAREITRAAKASDAAASSIMRALAHGLIADVRYDTKLWMRDLMEGAAYLPK
jgi:hypothetical protein